MARRLPSKTDFDPAYREVSEDYTISISDLMTGLLMIFILVLILAVYTHTTMIQEKTGELERRSAELARKTKDLTEKEKELLKKDTRILEIEKVLSEKKEELRASQAALDGQKELLMKRQAELAALENELGIKKAELRKNEILLEETMRRQTILEEELKKKEATLFSQGVELDRKSEDLKRKEMELQAQRELLMEKNSRIREIEKALALQQKILEIQKTALDDNREKVEKFEALLKDRETTLADREKKITEETAVSRMLMDELALARARMKDQKEKIDRILGLRQTIISDLKASLTRVDESLRLEVDQETGSIRLSGDVLFDYNSSEIRQDFEYRLKLFFDVYIRVLFENSAFKPSLAEIIIEGHADPKGSYIYNLDLSQKRAFSVMRFFLEHSEPGIQKDLQRYVTAAGRSFSHTLKLADGTIDEGRSRRIEIKFRLKDDEALKELTAILGE